MYMSVVICHCTVEQWNIKHMCFGVNVSKKTDVGTSVCVYPSDHYLC